MMVFCKLCRVEQNGLYICKKKSESIKIKTDVASAYNNVYDADKTFLYNFAMEVEERQINYELIKMYISFCQIQLLGLTGHL